MRSRGVGLRTKGGEDGNKFGREFADFLNRAPDILRYAALGTTEQRSSDTSFRADYRKPSGTIGFYYPDWMAVQRDLDGKIVNWIIETKGRVWEGAEEKDAAMHDWCKRTSRARGETWQYIRVDRAEFRADFATFRAMVFKLVAIEMFRERDASGATMTHQEFLQWRDEGRRY